jgi:hypothetical protein
MIIIFISNHANTTWCEPCGHVMHNQDWDLIPKSQKRSNRSMT